MKTQRIAYLVSQYPNVHHTFILREIRQLRDRGVQVDVISIADPDRDISLVTEIEAEEQRQTKYIKRVGLLGAIPAHCATFVRHPIRYAKELFKNFYEHGLDIREGIRSFFYFIEAVIVGRWLEKIGVKRIHCHFSSNVALSVTRLFDLELSLTVHGPTEFNDSIAFRNAEKVRVASKVIAISQFSRSQLMRFSNPEDWWKIQVIPLGINPEEFSPRTPPNNSSTDIICVGRLAGAKAQQVLISSMGRLVDSGYDVRLRLVGDGEDRARLEAHTKQLGIEENVIFEGWLNQDQVQDRLRRADIFALASFAEGVPVALMEAMAMEIPCVSTRITGIPELIRDEIDGLLVAPSDAGEFADAVAQLIDDKALYERIAKSGRLRVFDKYNLSKNCRTLCDALLGTESEPNERDLVGTSQEAND